MSSGFDVLFLIMRLVTKLYTVSIASFRTSQMAATMMGVKAQIEVVGGSPSVYKIVDKNLRNGLIEFSLLKESLDLHRWRKHYARKYPNEADWPGSSGSSPEDKKRRVRMDRLQELFCCGPQSDVAWLWKWHFLTPQYLADSGLRYGDVARILFEHYGNSPSRLEELAMKTVKREDRFLDEHLCPQVHANDQEGFFQPETYQHDLRHLTKVGRELLTQLKETHDDMRRNAVRPNWPPGSAWPGRTGVSFPALLRFLPVKKTTISLYEAFSRDLERQIAHDLNTHLWHWGPTKYALSVTIHCQNPTEIVRYIVKRPPFVITGMREFTAQFEEAIDDLHSLCQCYLNTEGQGFQWLDIMSVGYTICDWGSW